MRFVPCAKGPLCTNDLCNRFHGTEIRKSFKPCRFGGRCRYRRFCPFRHPLEVAKPGDLIWAWNPPLALAPTPAEPEPTGPPLPLDAITDALSGFLTTKEFQTLRFVNKACKEAVDSVPIQSLEMQWTTGLPKASLKHLSKLTFKEPHPPLTHMAPRLQRIAEIQRLRELTVPPTHLQAVLEALPQSSRESLEKISIVHPSAVTEFKLPESMSKLTRLEKLVLGVPGYIFRVDLEVLPKIPRLKRLKLQNVTPTDLKVFQHTRLEKVQILRAGIPLLNAILMIPTLQKLKMHNVRIRGNPSDQEVVVPYSLNLKVLMISHLSLELEQLICDVARAAPDLEVLHLDRNTDSDRITDFSQFKKLKLLGLVNNPWITSSVLEEIVGTLPSNIEHLYLHGSLIQDLLPLTSRLDTLPHLRSIGLNGVPVNDVTLKNLLKACVIHKIPLEQIGMTSHTITLPVLEECFAWLSQIPTMRRIFFYTDGCYLTSHLKNSAVRAAFKKHFANKSVVLHSSHTIAPSYRFIKG